MIRSVTAEALAGLRVVELKGSVAVAFCGRWLAAFGAEVVSIQQPNNAGVRGYTLSSSIAREQDTGNLDYYLRAGKRVLNLNLELGDNRAALEQLLRTSDVLIRDEGSTPPSLDLQAIKELNPRLVVVELSPFGSNGPYSGYHSSPLVLLALSGYQCPLCSARHHGGSGRGRTQAKRSAT